MLDYLFTLVDFMFSNLFRNRLYLPASVTVFVPSTSDVNNEDADLQAVWVSRLSTELASLFGGATATPATGSWVSDEIGLVEEGIVLVTSSISYHDFRKNAHKVIALVEEMKVKMGQEMVALKANNELFLI